ncbi:MAG: hypothetical protein H0U70_06270 [Tatlockia sp.]|nr:hypothetical protein [Tatlockia sp.]
MFKRIAFVIIGSVLLGNLFASETKFDQFNRLISYPGKIEMTCPKQSKDTAVLLVIGQSNGANHAEKKFSTRYPAKVFAYFQGKCYSAASPLLGASGLIGEFLTPLADKLIANGDFDSVVIIPSSIGGTAIARWQKGGDLNQMLRTVLAESSAQFKPTGIIWHQGESDFAEKTSAKDYKQRFNSLLASLRDKNKPSPPVFYAVATLCGHNPDWKPDNYLAVAQQSLANSQQQIYLAADTDQFSLIGDRDSSYCHLSEQGQLKTAAAFAAAIHQFYLKNK